MAPKRSVVTPVGTISRFFAPKQPKTENDLVQPAVKSAESAPPPPAISVAQSAPPSKSEEPTAPVVQSAPVIAVAQSAPPPDAVAPTPPAAADLAQVGERAVKTGGSLSELQLGSKKIPLLCTSDAELANEWAQDVQRGIDTGLSADVSTVMGVDCEWAASWFRPGCSERLATLQLCHHGMGGSRALVLHLLGFEGKLPDAVASLLADTRVAKVGAGIAGDARRLVRDFGCVVRGLYDLGRMDPVPAKKAVSLQDMVRAHCPSELHITKAVDVTKKGVRISNWEAWPLSTQQIDYAARDAALSVLAFVHRFGMSDENSLSESARETLVDLGHAEVEETPDAPMASDETSKVEDPQANAAPKAKAKAKAKAKSKVADKEAAVATVPPTTGDAKPEETVVPQISAAEATPSPKKRKADGEAKTGKKAKTANSKAAAENPSKKAMATKKENEETGAIEAEDQAVEDDGEAKEVNAKEAKKQKKGAAEDEGQAKKQKRVLTDEQKENFFKCMRNKALSPPNIGVKEHPIGGKDVLSKVVVIVSGILDSFERKDFEKYVLDHGGKVSKGVTAKVTHLVNDHGEAGPSKQAKCKEFGIPMVSEDVILKMVKDSL